MGKSGVKKDVSITGRILQVISPIFPENQNSYHLSPSPGKGMVIFSWFLNIYVVDDKGKPVNKVSITIKNVKGDTVWEGFTGNNGRVENITLPQYTLSPDGERTEYNPYKIKIKKGTVEKRDEFTMERHRTFKATIESKKTPGFNFIFITLIILCVWGMRLRPV